MFKSKLESGDSINSWFKKSVHDRMSESKQDAKRRWKTSKFKKKASKSKIRPKKREIKLIKKSLDFNKENFDQISFNDHRKSFKQKPKTIVKEPETDGFKFFSDLKQPKLKPKLKKLTK